MATKPTKPALDPERIRALASAIRSAVTPILAADETRGEAQEALNEAAQGASSLRESIMVKLAEMSANNAMTWTEIEVSARNAAEIGNKAEKSIVTFIGECKNAMHPDVRMYASDLVSLRNEAWDAEVASKKLDKDAPTPIKKAFVRKYHCLAGLFKAAKEGVLLTTEADLIAYAEARDPDLDIDKVFARLEKIRSQLQEFHADFPDDDVGSCAELLGRITKKDLTAARDLKTGNTSVDESVKPVVNNTTVVESVKPNDPPPAHIPTVVAESVLPAAGASDILDDVLGSLELAA
jgi:hypothetical protein